MKTARAVMESPVGPLTVEADAEGVRAIRFPGEPTPPRSAEAGPAARDMLRRATRELREYFQGQRRAFDVPAAPRGTPFQLRVWRALCDIPFGTTVSYGELARRLDAPRSSRAVGAANGRNPVPIVIPCHRVIGSDGSLTGFGGGLEIKQWLLEHEGVRRAATPLLFCARQS